MIQLVELLYRSEPQLSFSAIKERTQLHLKSHLDSMGGENDNKPFVVVHQDHLVKYSEGSLPAQTTILAAASSPKAEHYEQEIQQSWRCPDARDLIESCRATRLITELMTRGLAPQIRISIFHGVLLAAIELTNPIALVFKHTQQVITPADYMAASAEVPILRPGSMNVRFYNITDSGNDKLMDTRGLTEVGLHDLQCHFRNLDPQEVARVLFNTGIYIFEKGPIIESGQTVAGINADDKWQCQFEESLVGPKRETLDLNPGAPHAAGNRQAKNA